MTKVFRREVRANWKGLLFWALGMLALAGIGFTEYGGIANADASISQIFDLMPRIVQVVFGMGMLPVDTPEGYYACMFVWLCFVSYTYSALLGAGILSKEERDKTAEFLFTKPMTRTAALAGKALAGVLNMLVLAALSCMVTLAAYLPQLSGNDFAPNIVWTMVGMFITQLVYFAIGLAAAALAKDNKQATQWAAGVVIISYLVSALVEMADAEYLRFLTPFRYFNAVFVMQDGLQWLYLVLSAALVAAAGWCAWHFFSKRDLRN